jgi:hypothetical protein
VGLAVLNFRYLTTVLVTRMEKRGKVRKGGRFFLSVQIFVEYFGTLNYT